MIGCYTALKRYEAFFEEHPEAYDPRQQREIRWGCSYELDDEQMAVLARPELSGEQMEQVLWGFVNGLPIEQVTAYARPELRWEEMRAIRIGLEGWFGDEPIEWQEEIALY